jgi:SAM-dependent methyltransferase
MTLREAWTRFVAAEDYETHMAAVGQAQANASLVAELFAAAAPRPASRILIAGAGTGQMFEHCAPGLFHGYRLICSDINPAFLEKLRARCECQTVVDDIEDSRLDQGFSVILVVLVLEHVEWRKALASLARLRPEHVAVVIQRNPEGALPYRERVGTMLLFGSEVEPNLIPASALVEEFERLGFRLKLQQERPVADGKTMVGLLLEVTPA